MAAAASIVVLFGLSCPDPCPFSPSARAAVEQSLVREIAAQGFEVRPAPEDAVRPTGETSNLEPRDEAARLGAARVVVLDAEPSERTVWVTHFVRGTPGPWNVVRHRCAERSPDGCGGIEASALAGLRPRTVDDVDFVGVLSRSAPDVGACVRTEDEVPPALRIFGRVEMELEVTGDGNIRMVAIAPARVARAALGRCLRAALERREVGPFKGQPVRLRIPLDL